MKNKPSRQVLRARRRAGLSTPQRQRGAAAVFAGAAIVALVISILLAINIGMLYYAQRDLQKLAVLSAMAGVQTGSGCIGGNGPSDTPTVTTRVQAALANNSPSGSNYKALLNPIGGLPAVQLGMVTTGKPGAKTNDGQHHFSTLADNDPRINAVVVNLTEPQPTILGGLLFSAPQGTLYASATAMQQPQAGFSVGSTLATLNTQSSTLLNPLLNGLLGTSVNLNLVDYTNLASAQVSLAGLMVGLGVNDLNSLLSATSNVGALRNILVGLTQTTNPSVSSLLQGLTLGSAQASASVPLATLLGDIGNGLNPTVNDAAALVPSLDVLDLLEQIGETAAAQNPGSFITLSGTPSIDGLLSTYVFLSVQQPMQAGFGPVGAQAQTAQVTLGIRASIDPTSNKTGLVGSLLSGVLGLLNGILSLLGSSITIPPINIGLDVAVAKTVGTLASLTCPTSSNPSPSATVGVNASAATLTLGTFTANAQTDPKLIGGPFVQVVGTGLLTGLSSTVAIKNVVSSSLGNSSGAVAGPFSIYGPGYLFQPTLLPHSYNYQACNSTVANPSSCGTTTDPNNPAAPIPTADILQGVSSLVGSLANNNNLQVIPAGINLSAILDPLISALNTVLLTPLTAVLDAIIDPLLAALGIQLASGTVLMTNIETGPPVLVNTALPGTPNF